MKREHVSAYCRACLVFLIIPWLINFFVPVLMFLPLSTTIERTRPPGTYLEIMSAVFSLVVVLCYLLLGKYIQEKMGDTDEILVERNDSQSLKKLYSSERNDIVLYSIASLALPVLVYCLQNIFGAAEKQPEINPYLLPIALVVGPVIEEFLFRKVLYLYCKKNGIDRFVFLSALFFTLIHGYSISVAGGVMFLGKFVFAYFFLAALYSIYKCLHISIQMHICWNLSIFLIGMFHLDTLAPIVFFMMSLLIVLYAIFRIIRKQRLVRAEEVG